MTTWTLREFHQELGATLTSINGVETVAHYGDPLAEHRALTGTVGILDLSCRGRLVLLGTDRHKMLNGQVTNDILGLRPGAGCYAALVNAKARMLSDLHVYALPQELLLDFEPGLTATVTARLEQFIITEDVQVVDAAPHYGLLSIQGPRATRVVAELGLFPSPPEAPLTFVSATDPTLGELYLVHHARTGSAGFDLFAPTAALAAVADRAIAAARNASGRACGWEALEIARVEAGIPRYGADMDETNLPPETGIEASAISYTKGCYSGQEVIARIRTYGKVARALRGLRLPDDLSDLPPRGTKLFHDAREVGHLTSVVRSPILGGGIALGYVRRECNQLGNELALGSPDSPSHGVIVPLPFTGPLLA